MPKITLESGKTIEISNEKYAELVPKNNKNWRAEEWENYFYIASYGAVIIETERNTDDNDSHYNTLNYYQTREEAEKARERQIAIGFLTRKINELNGDWEADWGDSKQKKYSIYYDYTDKRFTWLCHTTTKDILILPHLASSEIKDKILSENEKELSIIWEL
jgi:hypothetical protein